MQATHLIGGRWDAPADALPALDVHDPATGAVIATIPVGGVADAERAIAAARSSAASWARTPAGDRSAALRAAAAALRPQARDLAVLQTDEMGRPIAESLSAVEAAIAALTQYAELGALHRGRSLLGAWEAADFAVPEPYGVAVLLVPWNDPLVIVAQLLAAALVVGNTVVIKPSERAPLAVRRLTELIAPHMPDGVVNLLLGDASTGWALVDHPEVDLVLHTGSVATGRSVATESAERLRKVVVELGGKDALIVDAGVDPVWAARQAAAGAFANAGQVGTSVERIYVHAGVATAFIAALVAAAQALVVGDGHDPATTMGPLIDRPHRALVHGHVADALQAGATLLTGGETPDGPGSFYPPTVLTDVTVDMAVASEETRGPIAAVQVVPDFATALLLANTSEYGMAATVLTPSQQHAQQAWRELAVGTVKINAVGGGAPGGAAQPRGISGLGHGSGPELLDEVSRTKVVHQRALRADGTA